ncbi:MAG: ABC transporter permease [Rhizobium sp.]|nr:ABC transporter permease [Rhizobium sp.]
MSSRNFSIGTISQEKIVFAIAVLLFVFFSVYTTSFLRPENIMTLLRNVSVLGILGVAMAGVVIGRGIDLSIVSVFAMSTAWTLQLMTDGTSLPMALAAGFLFALLVGISNGVLVAYVEIPAIFATLAMGTFIYGIVRLGLIDLDVIYMPPAAESMSWLGSGLVMGIPVPVILFAVVCIAGHLFLRHTKHGRFIYSIGDNHAAARITGIPVRPIIVLQYLLASGVGYLAGIITATSVASMNTRVAISTMVYDIILVVVIGGIGLAGGRGGIRNVVVGTLLIGILLNGMTILDIQYTVQNIIKSGLLLAAIVADSIINPRDEQTAQQGDI